MTGKLVVLRGFQENLTATNLLSEGRELEISITKAGSKVPVTDLSILRKLSRLAVCSSFEVVNMSVESKSVLVAVKVDSDDDGDNFNEQPFSTKKSFENSMAKAGKYYINAYTLQLYKNNTQCCIIFVLYLSFLIIFVLYLSF